MNDDDGDHEVRPKTVFLSFNKLSRSATQETSATALSVITTSLGHFGPDREVDLLRDLTSLAEQTQGRKTETLKVIIEDADSTCSQFGYDIGDLTETQAKLLLVQVVSRREIEEQHERELEKITLQSSLGFFGRLASWLGRGS
jgi:hypothetical protein